MLLCFLGPWKCSLRRVPQKKDKLLFSSSRLALMVTLVGWALVPGTVHRYLLYVPVMYQAGAPTSDC